jgi:zinc transport system substrate-binding protein
MTGLIARIGSAAFAFGVLSGSAHADNLEAWRLFVSDHATGTVNVVDPLARKTLDTFTLEGPSSLYRSESGETIFAIQGAAGVVQAMGSGIAFTDHGEHGDIEVSKPGLLDFRMEGTKPGHFMERQGQIALWFDGEDKARLFSESDALRGQANPRDVAVDAAHHGVGIPYGDHAVVSVPNPEDASKRPIGARVVKGEAEQVGEVAACPGLHGSAGSGSLYALACDTGLLLIEARDGTPEIRHLPYAASLPEGSSSTLLGGKGLRYFVGNYGADRIVLIDPQAQDAFRLVQLPTRRVHFAVDPIRSRDIYVITEDGWLHRVDFLSGTIVASAEVTRPYSMDGHWSDPRPRLALAGDKVIVTDPLEGRLRLMEAETLKPAGEIALDGVPFNVVAVGGSGQTHATE